MTATRQADDAGPRNPPGEWVTARPYGPRGWLLVLTAADTATAARQVHPLARHLEHCRPEGLREIIPAFDRILLDFETPANAASFRRHWESTRPPHPTDASTADLTGTRGRPSDESCRGPVEIAVHFDGLDRAQVARQVGLSEEAVIDAFCASPYRVQCLGFSPGFPYLTGLPARLAVPRHATPRARVPAGSVAIGGSHAGIYPQASPGGWNLLGRTDERLFDPTGTSLDAIFRLHPGDVVRFHRRPAPPDATAPAIRFPDIATPSIPSLGVHQVGWGLRVQDLGRPGHRRFGVPAGGAMDPASAQAANRLLDNPPDAPVLELCGQGQVLEALEDLWIGVVGVSSATGRTATTRRLRAGERFEVPRGPLGGVWSYVALPGGIAAPRFLGSTSALPHGGRHGGFQPGDRIARMESPPMTWPGAVAGRFLPVEPLDPTPIRLWPGLQWDDFPERARAAFLATPWTVSSQSDRVGYRLHGPPLVVPSGSALSEPVLAGSVQVPPEGLPIVTMPDGPTLGGYPKLGLVDPDDLPRLAQHPPGRAVRFVLHAG